MHKVTWAVFLLLLIASCRQNNVVGETKTLPNSWDKEPIIFSLPKLDSLKKYNIFLHLRNTNDYPYSNIYLIATLNFPHGKTTTDTLQYKMAAPDGTWLGTGIGTVKENKLWYKEDFLFSEDGTYTLQVSQAVRNNGEVEGVLQLQGITEVGYSIEEINN